MKQYGNPLSFGFRAVAHQVCFQQTVRFLNAIPSATTLVDCIYKRCGHFRVSQCPNLLSNKGQSHHCDHSVNHFQNQLGSQRQDPTRNPLCSNYQRVSAIWNASQFGYPPVILEAMRRQKLDPKHVRDFFFDHALSVRIMTLCFDGIWWLISKGFQRVTFGLSTPE